MITLMLGLGQWLMVREVMKKTPNANITGAGCMYALSIPADFTLILLAILLYFGRI